MLTTNNASVVKVKTPDGSMFVVICEDNKGDPEELQLHIGKAGTTLSAWAFAFTSIANLALAHGASLYEIMEEISNTTSDKLAFTAGKIPIHSGPDGVAYALLRYVQHKAKELKKDEHVIFRNYEF